MAGHGDGGGESASFEGAGGIQAFIFDEDVGIFAAGQHGSKTFAERDGRGFGKDGVVTPHGGSERQQRCGRETLLDVGEIVAGVEDAAIFGANSLRTVGGIMLAAAGAFEVSEARHGKEFIRGEHLRTNPMKTSTQESGRGERDPSTAVVLRIREAQPAPRMTN